MIELLISGGQTGADQGGLEAAIYCDIPTGGYAPKGYKTENGCNEKLLKGMYGLEEHASPYYEDRTLANVKMSDGTAIFGHRSRGSNLTERYCQSNSKPLIWIWWPEPKGVVSYRNIDSSMLLHTKGPPLYVFKLWMAHNQIRTLNIAGNRESTNPGIGDYTTGYMMDVFQLGVK